MKHGSDVFGLKAVVVKRHLGEEPEGGAQPLVDGRRGVVVEDLFGQRFIVESGRRDRGVGVGSKMAPIQPRDESRKQLALSDRPLGGPAHDGMRMNRMRSPEKMAMIFERSDDIRCTKAGDRAHQRKEKPDGHSVATLDVDESHVRTSACRAAASRSCAAPKAVTMMISKS